MSFPSEDLIMVVTAGSVYSETFRSVYNMVKRDAAIASGTFSNFPRQQNVQYPLYTVETDTDARSFKSFADKNEGKKIDVIITCFSQSTRQVDELADELENIFKNGGDSLSKSGLAQPMFTRAGVTHPILNDELVHAVACNLNMEFVR